MAKILRGIRQVWTVPIEEFRINEDVEGVGVIRFEGDRIYRWVCNKHGSDLAIGAPVCYKMSQGRSMYRNVYQPVSADINTYAGSAMSAIPTLKWGWIQIEGYFASNVLSIGKTDITAGIIAQPADTVDYLVGGAMMSLSMGSTMNQMAGRLQLVEDIDSSASSAAGSDAGTTNVAGFIHCFHV